MIRGRLETGASDGLTKDTTRLPHGRWHDHVSEYTGIGICAESFGLGNSLRNYRFYVGLTSISKRKGDANKQNFERVLNLTWKVKVNQPQNNRDLKQKLLNFLSKYDDSSWNVWWVITRTKKLTDTQKHTNPADENTRRLILASGKKPISQGITWHVAWNALVATLYQNYITTPWPFSIIANILLWTAPSCIMFHRQWLDPHSLCRHKDIS